ncbi:hypothetical protein BSK56_18790 [Paenibacillus borealis]|uniref:Uncharacterized protein n=1 Tax=Paenibacillus borealis TaxID=160799 RepID=A0ABX3H906_PAEBO|nr:hypothetical protein BSK56_18790 [Paenibacillus borealis]
MYRKARLLEYDKREAEKVQRNSRQLDRQRNTKLTGIVLTAVAVFAMIKLEVIDQVLLVLLSLLLIGIGLMVENTEFTWDQESD